MRRWYRRSALGYVRIPRYISDYVGASFTLILSSASRRQRSLPEPPAMTAAQWLDRLSFAVKRPSPGMQPLNRFGGQGAWRTGARYRLGQGRLEHISDRWPAIGASPDLNAPRPVEGPASDWPTLTRSCDVCHQRVAVRTLARVSAGCWGYLRSCLKPLFNCAQRWTPRPAVRPRRCRCPATFARHATFDPLRV